MKNWKREFRELFVRSIGSAEDVISFIEKEKQKSYGEGRKRGVRFAEDKNDLTSVDVDKEGFENGIALKLEVCDRGMGDFLQKEETKRKAYSIMNKALDQIEELLRAERDKLNSSDYGEKV